jgi:hypothetical protein
MTNEPDDAEGAEEAIEDLEAPSTRQSQVVGGQCQGNTCLANNSAIFCGNMVSCTASITECSDSGVTAAGTVWERLR